MTLLDIVLLILTGFGGGLVGSMLGVGGGMIIIPVLTTLFSFKFEEARAISLFAVIATSCGVAAATSRERFGNLRVSVLLAFPTALVALANATLSKGVRDATLYLLFAGVLTVAGALMWRRERTDDDSKLEDASRAEAGPLDGIFYDPKLQKNVIYRVRRVPGLIVVSAMAGAVSGLLGVGGGVFQVPAMSILGGMPMRAAAATSNFLLGVTAAASLPLYMGRLHVRPIDAGAIVLGVLGGALAGAGIAKKVGGTALKRLFTVVIAILAMQMLWKASQ